MPAWPLAVSAALLLAPLGAGAARSPAAEERVIRQIEQLIAGQRALRVYDWVGFELNGSEVTLRGAVTRAALKRSIERSVLALEAVSAVRDEIELLPRSGDDIGIRVNAYWRIYGHPEIRRYLLRESGFRPRLRRSVGDEQRVLIKPVHIVVRDGHLTLEGELERRREKAVTGQQARAVLGVRSVTNNIVVTGADTEEYEPIDFEADPWWTDSESVQEPVLRIENPAGAVRVRVTRTDRVRVRRSSRERPVRTGDTRTTRLGRKTRVRAQPDDGAAIDLDVDLPYGHRLEVKTVDGPIGLAGLARRARLETAIGRIEVAAPWRSVRLEVESAHRPGEVAIAERARAWFRVAEPTAETRSWALRDARDPRDPVYGSIHVSATSPEAFALREASIPADSPVKMHWQAPEAIRTMLRRPFRMRLRRPGGSGAPPDPAFGESAGGVAQFNSEVRLVQLLASVVDAANRPVTGLGRDDFAIFEDGVAQRLRLVQGSEAPFNLVLLLDCSTSTLAGRKTVLEAARRFTRAARHDDQVAIYVLSNAYVHVVSPLTADRAALLGGIERLPRLSGGTPLYDAIVLGYAQELARRRWERNALIVISDGMDNDLLPPWSRLIPSLVPFEDLQRAAAEMNSAIYPIFLEPDAPGVRTERSWWEQERRATDRARERMRQLATATGGKLFRASSVRELDLVYEQVAEELRSVYTLGYYPSNQDFDGTWRRIRVQVHGHHARTRPGYYGW